jgi:rubrerythrin
MGLIQSQEDISFRRETPIIVRQNHTTTSKTDLSKLPEDNEKKIVRHRSHSFAKNENKHIQRSSSLIKRKWQCQLCQTLNETDSQLCSDCGTSKINVYIPIMNQNQTSEK